MRGDDDGIETHVDGRTFPKAYWLSGLVLVVELVSAGVTARPFKPSADVEVSLSLGAHRIDNGDRDYGEDGLGRAG